MNTNTTRRHILAGAAALPALAAPAALASLAPDPIFAAIEAHRAAYQAHIDLISNVPSIDDDLICSGAEYEATHELSEQTAIDLTCIEPTTIAGVIALLAYVDHFNRGGITTQNRGSVYSYQDAWPETLQSDDVLSRRGKPLGLPFECWIMRNAKEALEAISARIQARS